jgi:hypothetical protein
MFLVSQAAQAFFCLSSGSGNRSFGRPAPYRGAFPRVAYQLPPIMPQRPVKPKRGTKRRTPPRAFTWRPIHPRTFSY